MQITWKRRLLSWRSRLQAPAAQQGHLAHLFCFPLKQGQVCLLLSPGRSIRELQPDCEPWAAQRPLLEWVLWKMVVSIIPAHVHRGEGGAL